MLLPLDSPAVRCWLEAWDPDKHPRGFHGRFGPSVGAVRADRRLPRQVVRDTRTPRSAGLTDQHWLTAYHSHRRGGETLEQYKKRATADALARGMTQDDRGFFYKPSDKRHRHPLSPSGFGVAVAPPRVQQHKADRPNADRTEEQRLAGMKPRRQKYRRARTGVLEKVGYRTVGTHTGQRRAISNRTAHEALFGYSPALARWFEAETSVAGVRGAEHLHAYWTRGEGLAKWAESPKPWTALRDHLLEFMPAEKATRTATVWFHDVFGFYPGSDLNRVTHGKPPRGHVVGPG